MGAKERAEVSGAGAAIESEAEARLREWAVRVWRRHLLESAAGQERRAS